jgi:hypothetical protein
MKHYKDANTNEIYAYEADGSQDAFIKEGLVAITDAEVASIRAAQQAAAEAALTYAQKRAAEYPSFADQFDLLYHGGMDAWKAAIDVVKNKYPKV